MLGQVDIGTLAQRRTNGWQMVGPTLAHRRPNIGMFMGVFLTSSWGKIYEFFYDNCASHSTFNHEK